MAPPLGIEYAGAIYHAMSRGNTRQQVFHDPRDYGWFFEGLEATVDKFRFELLDFVCSGNEVCLHFGGIGSLAFRLEPRPRTG